VADKTERSDGESGDDLKQLVVAVAACQRHGVDGKLALGAVTHFGHREDIAALSTALVERIRARPGKTPRRHHEVDKGGVTKMVPGRPRQESLRARKAIEPALVGFLLAKMIERCAAMGWPPPPALAELILIHTRAIEFAANLKMRPQGRAVDHLARNPGATVQELADVAGVSRVTASKWKLRGR
jgi:hypothetical protein